MINSYRSTVKPECETKWQNHLETEVIVIIKGKGRLYSDSLNLDFEEMHEGDVKILPPFKTHVIRNNTLENLEIIGIYWAESPKYIPNNEGGDIVNLILPSFTTPNGRMHLGHIGGPVLLADIFKRAQICLGFKDSYELTGSIGFQTHVSVTAKKLGLSYFDTAIKFSDDFLENYKNLNIDFDEFITLKDYELYEQESLEFINHLKSLNLVQLKEKNAPFCESCNKFIFEVNVIGGCPSCHDLISGECETCAEFVPDDNIIDPKCKTCGNEAIFRPLKRMFINLENYREIIQNLLMRGTFRGNAGNDVERFLSKTLPEIPLSIYAEEGIPFPEFEGQKIYSAIELIPRFLTALRKLSSKRHFETNSKFRLNLFFGKDNSYLRCIIFPILLKVYKPDIICDLFFSNEFWNLGREKFSTSRGNVLYADNLLREIDADWIRFCLTLADISAKECNFEQETAKNKVEIYNFSLYGIIGRINAKMKDDFAFKIPEAGIWEKRHIYFYEFLESQIKMVAKAFSKDAFNPSKINDLARNILEELSAFSLLLDLNYTNKNIYRTVMALNLLGLKVLFLTLAPIMPIISRKILDSLQEDIILNLEFPKPNTLINEIKL